MSQLTVVRQQHEAAGGQVEPSDRVHPRYAFRKEIPHRRPPFRVSKRGDHAAWLVQEEVGDWLGADRCSVDLDPIDARANASPQIVDTRPVDTDAPLADEVLGGTPRCDTGPGENLLEAFASVGGVRGALTLVRRAAPTLDR